MSNRFLRSLVAGGAATVVTAALSMSVASAEARETLKPSGAFSHTAVRGATSAGIGHAQAKPGSGSKVPQYGINYHGGPVMTATKNAYIIWYGDWSGGTKAPSSNSAAQSLIKKFLGSVGGSPYFNINTTYVDGTLTKVSNSVAFAGEATDNYSKGTALSDAAVASVVSNALARGALPTDANGVYFVLTSSDVDETSGFLTQYCGWHTYGTMNNAAVKYSFVGDPARGLNSCAAQTTGPNPGTGNADAMISVIAHELEEAATDPLLNAWYDRRGYENADKCAWTFGTTSTASNGASYNMTLGGTNYLVQQNWLNVPTSGYCAMSY